MRKRRRDHGLSLTMGDLFLCCFLGHSLTGYDVYFYDYQIYTPSLRFTAYITSSHVWASVFENWESALLHMAAYVLRRCCFQRGSAESKDPDTPEDVDEDPHQHHHEPQAPGPVRKGGSR